MHTSVRTCRCYPQAVRLTYQDQGKDTPTPGDRLSLAERHMMSVTLRSLVRGDMLTLPGHLSQLRSHRTIRGPLMDLRTSRSRAHCLRLCFRRCIAQAWSTAVGRGTRSPRLRIKDKRGWLCMGADLVHIPVINLGWGGIRNFGMTIRRSHRWGWPIASLIHSNSSSRHRIRYI